MPGTEGRVRPFGPRPPTATLQLFQPPQGPTNLGLQGGGQPAAALAPPLPGPCGLRNFLFLCVPVLLLSQLLDEDGDGGALRPHLLDEGVVVLPLRLQTHLETPAMSAPRGKGRGPSRRLATIGPCCQELLPAPDAPEGAGS